MNKNVLKLLVIFCGLFLFNILPDDSLITLILHIVFLLIVSTVLIIIIIGLLSHINFRSKPYLKTKYKNIEVSFTMKLNGGGVLFAQEFVRVISKRIGPVDHVFEYCAGPGFIGFSLLAHGLCKRLTLAEINPKAIAAIKDTIKNNNLSDKVKVYEGDCLDPIPAGEKWDLVVGNPPWNLKGKSKRELICHDPGSRVHEKFYKNIDQYLKPDGSILFIECGEYTTANLFSEMIEKNELTIIESFKSVSLLTIFKNMGEYIGLNKAFILTTRFLLAFRETYFIWVKKKSNL